MRGPVSFAQQIKSEICGNRPFCQRHRRALAYGLLLYGRSFTPESICLHTEHRRVARLYADSIADLAGLSGSITLREVRRQEGKSVYVATVDSLSDRRAVLEAFSSPQGGPAAGLRQELVPPGEEAAFLSGVFLACGGVSDPEKDYHAEFSVADRQLCQDLEALLGQVLSPPKRTTRRNSYLVYYKESEQIEDLLTFIGAPKCSMELMEVKMVKELRNKVNRATNCETANISKTVAAAVAQQQAIQKIQDTCGLGALDEELRELARLRLENPEMSLRELGSHLSQPISRSGVNHRMRRILGFAEELEQKRRTAP